MCGLSTILQWLVAVIKTVQLRIYQPRQLVVHSNNLMTEISSAIQFCFKRVNIFHQLLQQHTAASVHMRLIWRLNTVFHDLPAWKWFISRTFQGLYKPVHISGQFNLLPSARLDHRKWVSAYWLPGWSSCSLAWAIDDHIIHCNRWCI